MLEERNDIEAYEETFTKMIDSLSYSIVELYSSSHGEKSLYLHTYLHCLSEIQLTYQKCKESRADPNGDIEYCNFTRISELMTSFDSRTQMIDSSVQNLVVLDLIYTTRTYLLACLERPFEVGYWLINSAKMFTSKENTKREALETLKMCEPYKEMIPDYELERAKYMSKTDGWLIAVEYLTNRLDNVTSKSENLSGMKDIYRKIHNSELPQKAQLFLLETSIENEEWSQNIESEYKKFLNSNPQMENEHTFYVLGKYLDGACNNQTIKTHTDGTSAGKQLKKNIQQPVDCYFKSLARGNNYLWQSLPRLLDIWFNLSIGNKMQITSMGRKLLSLETYKQAQVVQILLSRFQQEGVKTCIAEILGKVASEYPLQSAWWIFHYKYFYRGSKSPLPQSDSRQQFADEVIQHAAEAAVAKGNFSVNTIKEYLALLADTEKFFILIINFSYTKVDKRASSTDAPKELIDFFDKRSRKIIMPTEENLRPLLPTIDNPDSSFSCYNPKPVFIKGIMKS